MKSLKYLFVGVLTFTVLLACQEKEAPNNSNEDEAYFASKATISSDASEFTSTEEGGIVHFAAEGGQVKISVDCGVDWTIENTASDLFTASTSVVTLTLTAVQNTVEQEQKGTITLYTSASRIKFATISIIQEPYNMPDLAVDTEQLRFPAVGELTAEIAVDAMVDWEYKYSANWLAMEKTDTGLKLTADENGDTTERSDAVVILINDGVNVVSRTIEVTQDGVAYINTSISRFTLYKETGSSKLTVDSNYDWDYSYDRSNGWYTLSRDGDVLTASVTANSTDSEREDVITLTAGDGAENNTELQLSIIQYGDQPDALIFEYTVSSSNAGIQLPIAGSVNCSVDWGDDTEIETVTSANPAHTYASSGTFDVRVNGKVTSLSSLDISSNAAPNTTITAVKQWGHTGLTDMSYAFFYCTNLNSLPGDTSGAFEDVTLFDYAFQATALKSVPADLFAYAGKATSFIQTFFHCQSLQSIPEGFLSACSKIQSFYATFNYCKALETIPVGMFSSCTEVLNFNGTFYGCSSLQAIPDGLFDSCTKATDFTYTFGECSSLTSIPAGLFSKCESALLYYGTFYYCTSITAIPERLFENNAKAVDFTGLFYMCESIETMASGIFDGCVAAQSFNMTFVGCTALSNVPAGLFDDCTEVTTFASLFEYDESIKSIPTGLFDHCPKVTSFYAAFYGLSISSIPTGLFDSCTEVTSFYFAFYNCKGITEIPEGLFDTCTKVTNFNACFYNCQNLAKVPENLFKNCPEVTDFSWCFYQCKALTTFPTGIFDYNKKVVDFRNTFYNIPDVTGESPYTVVDGVKVHLYERSAAYGFTTPTSYSGCFRSCKQLDDYSSIPNAWK